MPSGLRVYVRTAPGRPAGLLAGGIVLLLAGSASTPAPAVTADDAPGTAHVDLDAEGRLSVAVTAETDLAAVLGKIGQAAGVELEVHGDLGTVPPRSLSGVPLDEGIRRLVGRHSLVMVYRGSRPRSATGPAGPSLRMVRVYQHRGADETKMAVPPAAAAVRPPEPPHDGTASRGEMQRRIIELSYQRDAAALEELRRLLAAAADARVRRDAANALASIASAEALDALGRVGLGDEDSRVRVAAARGLWRVRGDATRLALVQALAKEQDTTARRELEAMLGGSRASMAAKAQTRPLRREAATAR